MVGSVGRIDQDIAAIEQGVMAIAQELQTSYSQYLSDLGLAVRQQLILASYRLCTQGYPDRFLQLSFNQRQNLQQSLQQLARQAQTQLLDFLQPTESLVQEPLVQEPLAQEPLMPQSNHLRNELLSELLGDNDLSDSTIDEETIDEETGETDDQASDSVVIDQAVIEADASEANTGTGRDADADAGADTNAGTNANAAKGQRFFVEVEPPRFNFDRPMSPVQLAQWQESLEQHTQQVLQRVSHAANHLLQQAEILPNTLPEPVLEVAAKANVVAESAANTPNLLNLLVETEEQEKSKVTHIIAIRLRLFEIEFGNAALANGRSKIRGLMARLNQLGRDYQKKQRSRSIAEAEAAWRSSWFEE